MSAPIPDWTSPCGTVQLYCEDCRDILPHLGKVDAVVTDPPYGIGETNARNMSRENIAKANDYGEFTWDCNPPSPEEIDLVRSSGTWAVIFGGNYFNLPPSSCWLVWDKMNGDNDFADCELAWTNLPSAVRVVRCRWNGMIRDEKSKRCHPTQKPVTVMQFAISKCLSQNTILDPYMGSGTTGVAAIRLGRSFIGIERERHYYEIAKRRIMDALGMEVVRKDGLKQRRMFAPAGEQQ